MTNYLKHNHSATILSAYNPLLAFSSDVQELANKEYIKPIVNQFLNHRKNKLEGKQGKPSDFFEPLDTDILKTEIEFQHENNYVQNYVYEHLITEITKNKHDGKVNFKRKYVITFDKELAPNFSDIKLPYPVSTTKKIRYGEMCLGEEPFFYFIYIDLQDLLKFIKERVTFKQPEYRKTNYSYRPSEKEEVETKEARNRLLDDKIKELKNKDENSTTLQEEVIRLQELKKAPILGKAGKLNIRLMWQSTDDLDLHVTYKEKEVYYSNKREVIENCEVYLDVDANVNAPYLLNPQENIFFSEELPEGEEVKVEVCLYTKRSSSEAIDFELLIIPDENSAGGKSISGKLSNDKERREVAFIKRIGSSYEVQEIPSS